MIFTYYALSPRWICCCSPQQISELDSRDWLLWVIVPGTTSNIIYPTKSVKRTATTDKIRHPLNAPLDSTLPKSLLLSLYSPLDSIIQYSAPHMSSPNFRWVNVGHDGVASGGRKVPNRELLFCHRCSRCRKGSDYIIVICYFKHLLFWFLIPRQYRYMTD